MKQQCAVPTAVHEYDDTADTLHTCLNIASFLIISLIALEQLNQEFCLWANDRQCTRIRIYIHIGPCTGQLCVKMSSIAFIAMLEVAILEVVTFLSQLHISVSVKRALLFSDCIHYSTSVNILCSLSALMAVTFEEDTLLLWFEQPEKYAV